MVQDIQDNSLPLGSGALGLAKAIPSAELFFAFLLGLFLWQDCPAHINQVCYVRKAFHALQHQVSGSHSSSTLLLLLLFHTADPCRFSHSHLTVGAVSGSGGGQLTICTDISEKASLQSVVALACEPLRGRNCGVAPLHAMLDSGSC